MVRYLTRQRAIGLVPMSAYIPRQLNEQVAQVARQHQTSHGVIVESALLDGLRLLRPSAVQMAQKRRRTEAALASLPLSPMQK